MAYWRLFYHLVWATYRRDSLINSDVERIVHGCLHSKAKDLGVWIHEIGNVDDHVHVVLSIPPTSAIADTVGQMKGSSSHAVNQAAALGGTKFRWQDGYGVLSLGERSLPVVTDYVKRQKEHHRRGTTQRVFEQIAEG